MQPSAARQDRITGRLILEVARQIAARQPDVSLGDAEHEYIATEVRRLMFQGAPMTASDVGRIVATVLRRRHQATALEQKASHERPPSEGVNVSQASSRLPTLAAVASLNGNSPPRRATTPSAAGSVSRRSNVGSCSGSDISAARSRQSLSLSSRHSLRSRLSAIKDSDRIALDALRRICDPETAAVDRPPRAPRRAVQEHESAVSEAAETTAARAKVLKMQAELRRALDEQVAEKKARKAAEEETVKKEREERVAAAQASLAEDAQRLSERRLQRTVERQQSLEALTELVQRKRGERIAELATERDMVGSETEDHEAKLKEEHERRRNAILSLREELAKSMEERVREKRKQHLAQLEYEMNLLGTMNEKIEAERRRQEEQRLRRIVAAREAQESCRRMVEDSKRRDAAVKNAHDQLTVESDKSFIEREKAEALHRRRVNRETQDFLAKQILARQLRDALRKSDEDPQINSDRFEEAEMQQQQLEERSIKLEAQRQWRAFLDLQHQAKLKMRSVSEVTTPITRPVSNTPWF